MPKRILIGKVTSNKADKTITVIVEGEHIGKKRLILPHNKTTIKDAVSMIEPS